MERDESALIRLSRQGDAQAFRALLDLHYATVFKMAFHLCGHREDAEDITQMACLKVAQSIASFEGRAKFTTWLYTIVLNTFRDWTSNRANTGKGRVSLEGKDDMFANDDNPEKTVQAREQLRALDGLPPEERETVVLVFAHGCSHKEAADILGIAESTVSWRVHEVRKKLTALKGGVG